MIPLFSFPTSRSLARLLFTFLSVFPSLHVQHPHPSMSTIITFYSVVSGNYELVFLLLLLTSVICSLIRKLIFVRSSYFSSCFKMSIVLQMTLQSATVAAASYMGWFISLHSPSWLWPLLVSPLHYSGLTFALAISASGNLFLTFSHSCLFSIF